MFDLKDYDIIALDIDGTVTDSKKRVTERTKEALYKAIDQGKKVVLASGRPEAGVALIAKEIGLDKKGGYLLCYNGGRIVDCVSREVLLSKEVENRHLKEIFASCRKGGVVPVTYEGEDVISWDPYDEYAQIEVRINNINFRKVENLEEHITWDEPKVLIVGVHDKLVPVEKDLKEKFGDNLSNLIENLNEIEADVIFIKNIDNVVPDRLKPETVYIFDMLSSCMNCEFYYEDGSTVPERELYNVRNWTCVYSVTPYVEGLTGTLHYIPQSPYVQTAQDARDHYIEIGSARYYIWGIHNSNKLKKFDGKTVTFGGFNYGDITSDVTDAPPGVTCYGFEATYIR